MKKRAIVILILILLFTMSFLSFNADTEDDWPMFRHDPQHTGYTECEMPDKLELLWKYVTNARIYTSPAVVDDKVYVGSVGNLYCLDVYTVKLIWQFKTHIDVSSPTVTSSITYMPIKRKIYVGSSDNYLYCLNADTGELIWNYKTGDLVLSSPAVADGRVYVGSEDNYIYCLNANTG